MKTRFATSTCVAEKDVSTFGVSWVREGAVQKQFPYAAIAEHRKQETIREALHELNVRVPKSHVSPSDSSVLVMEDVGIHKTLNELVGEAPSSDSVKQFIRDCGSVVAAIHEIPSRRAGSGEVTLHGDFSPQNVLVNESGLWVIDASPNYYSTFDVSAPGTRYVDVATFTLKLIWPFRSSTFRQLLPRLRLRKMFLASYQDAAAAKVGRFRHCFREVHLLFQYLVHRKLLKSHQLGNSES